MRMRHWSLQALSLPCLVEFVACGNGGTGFASVFHSLLATYELRNSRESNYSISVWMLAPRCFESLVNQPGKKLKPSASFPLSPQFQCWGDVLLVWQQVLTFFWHSRFHVNIEIRGGGGLGKTRVKFLAVWIGNPILCMTWKHVKQYRIPIWGWRMHVKVKGGTSFSSASSHQRAWALLLKWGMACNFRQDLFGVFLRLQDGSSFSSAPPHQSAWALLLKWEMACHFRQELLGLVRVESGTSFSSMTPHEWSG